MQDRPYRRRIARETLEIYAPIANRLGMNNIRVEFEELGFKAMYPLRSSMIEKAVLKARGNRKEVVSKILDSIETCMEREQLDAEVFGREKHLYSIYDKMRSKRRSFAEIMDVCVAVASGSARGRVVAVLEGGYSLEGLASATAASVGRLLDRPSPPLRPGTDPRTANLLEAYRRTQTPFWPVLGS